MNLESFKSFLIKEEKEVNISDLKLNPDGKAIAKGFFFWGGEYEGDKNKPVAVVKLTSGELYVLDGYHRIEVAKKEGKETISVKVIPMSDELKKRLKDEGVE